MSGRQLRIVVLSSVLVFSLGSLPVSAVPRERDRGRDTTSVQSVVEYVKRLISKALGDTMSVPKP